MSQDLLVLSLWTMTLDDVVKRCTAYGIDRYVYSILKRSALSDSVICGPGCGEYIPQRSCDEESPYPAVARLIDGRRHGAEVVMIQFSTSRLSGRYLPGERWVSSPDIAFSLA